MVNVPSLGNIQIDMCVANGFAYSLNTDVSHVMYRTVQPNRAQSDLVPKSGQQLLGRWHHLKKPVHNVRY